MLKIILIIKVALEILSLANVTRFIFLRVAKKIRKHDERQPIQREFLYNR